MKHEILRDMWKRLFDQNLSSSAQWRMLNGKNVAGRKLRHVRVNNCIMCTEEDLLAYLHRDEEEAAKPVSQPKSRSPKARQKASDAANAELDAMLK